MKSTARVLVAGGLLACLALPAGAVETWKFSSAATVLAIEPIPRPEIGVEVYVGRPVREATVELTAEGLRTIEELFPRFNRLRYGHSGQEQPALPGRL